MAVRSVAAAEVRGCVGVVRHSDEAVVSQALWSVRFVECPGLATTASECRTTPIAASYLGSGYRLSGSTKHARTKKATLSSSLFRCLVAGAGFEPTTFGL